MAEQEHHKMVFDSVRPSGEEEWHCPTCGRRILVLKPPANLWVTLMPGDETAIHSGAKEAGKIETTPATDASQAAPGEGESEALQPYIEWLEQVDFEALWQRSKKR